MIKNSKGALHSFRARIRNLETGRILQGHYLIVVDRLRGTKNHPELLEMVDFESAVLHTFHCHWCNKNGKYRLVGGTFKNFKYLDKKTPAVIV